MWEKNKQNEEFRTQLKRAAMSFEADCEAVDEAFTFIGFLLYLDTLRSENHRVVSSVINQPVFKEEEYQL